MGVLGDTHSVKDAARLGGGVDSCSLFDLVGWNACGLLDEF